MSCEKCPLNIVCEGIMRPQTVRKLAKLNKLPEPQMCATIADHIKNSEFEPDKAEIYRTFSAGKGTPKPHLSSLSEGDVIRRTEGPRSSRKTKARIAAMKWH